MSEEFKPALKDELLETALQYRDLGLSVIRVCVPIDSTHCHQHGDCKYPGKTPVGSWKEFQSRLATEDEIRSWFLEETFNIGIITGNVSNLIVLDQDGEDGLKSLEGKDLPMTPTSKSGRGLKYHFRPDGLISGNRVGFVPGLDIRAEGGMVVAPPSLHFSGQQYEWVHSFNDVVSAACPQWLKECLSEKKKENAPVETMRDLDWTTKAIQGVAEGQRNDTLTRLCGSLAGQHMARETANVILKTANNNNQPPLPEEEVDKIIESIYNAQAQKDSATVPAVPESFCVSAGEFLLKDLPPARWLIADTWGEESFGFIGGLPKTWKSLLVMKMALCISTGKQFFDKAVKRGNVLYIGEEGKPAETQRRIGMMCKGMEINPAELDNSLFFALQRGVIINSPVWQNKITQAIEAHHIAFVIFDPLARMIDADENQRRDMKEIIDFFRSIQVRYHCDVAVIHHYKKGAGDNQERAGQQLRGTGDFHAAADVTIGMHRTDEDIVKVRLEHREAAEDHFYLELVVDKANETLVLVKRTDNPVQQETADRLENEITVFLTAHPDGACKQALDDSVGGNAALRASAINKLIGSNRITKGSQRLPGKDGKVRNQTFYKLNTNPVPGM